MRAYHNSRELKFREPFGAVALGGAVSISVDTWDGEPDWAELRVRVNKREDQYITMERHGGRFSCVFTPDSADLFRYSFQFHWNDGGFCRYGPQWGRTGGVGQVYYDGDCPDYQITVYKPRKTPDWYKNAICYQIFPDRFFRGEDFQENAGRVFSRERRGTPKALVKKWDTKVGYKRMPSGRIKVWEFYGGTLRGIQEKLDYLKSLGITVIYLNPIFEAASNHRYDTGDYRKIDGLLGDEESFKSLCREAERRGISLILDGVFNHTGCDSKYFNKFGNYPGPGAFQGPDSPYYSWYRFYDFPNSYESWWGIDDLPDVEEHNPDYKNTIYGGEDSVVRHWLRDGAKGWRLDVADELPDDFIEGIKSAVVAEKGDQGLLMGEVWEDASNKVAYGELRRYFLGTELDCVMNYPFRTGVLDFLTGSLPAWDLQEMMETLKENYPPENFNASLNLMGSHDRPRVMTVLGGAPDPNTMTEAQRGEYKLPGDRRGLAKGRLWLMALLQMTLPGVPCVYYGDEAGMEGYSDPFNRGPFPWGHEDRDAFTIYRNAINLRRGFPELAGAGFETLSYGADVFGYTRTWEDGALTVLVNRGGDTQTVPLDMRLEDVTDVLGGARYTMREGGLDVTLWPMGSAILYFHRRERLGKTMPRGSGVLAHITSLPNGKKPGDIGPDAYAFVDFLHDSGQKYWQILPLNPTDAHGSPYAGASAFAGNIALLPESEEELRRQFAAFVPDEDYRDFRARNARWLEPYSVFAAVKAKISPQRFTAWPEKYRRYRPELLTDPEIGEEAAFQSYCQYRFDRAWHGLRAYAASRGVTVIGDMPMFVSGDSADVWAEPELFAVDGRGDPALIAGVPPTYMDAGQLWGNPVYNWDAMEADGYGWWMRRFGRMLELYDITRLDHFMSFESAWAVPAGKKPVDGSWSLGPGLKLFREAYRVFGPLPFVAEDLGDITPAVRALLARCGFPGADILQYQNADPLDGYYPPKEKIGYSGTHDNETLAGFAAGKYPSRDPVETARRLKERLFRSTAQVVILQLQDVLELGNEARMNTPGTTGKNWSWQAAETDFEGASERLLRDTINTKRS